uniref:Peptidase S1 domain-containing protein n=1 Tax=Neogobius melanostomus TaxID=47308 RepID=A0A8C6TGM1_9GOBI
MTFLCILAVLGLVAGIVSLEESRVCEPHSRPWQVRLHGAGSQSCSGVLIDKWWIITAFACFPVSDSTTASLGEHDLKADEGTEQHITVAEVIPHSPYRSPLHSLTMVRLSRPAQLNQYVRPLPLPGKCPQPGDTCSVSGWGSTGPNPNEFPGLLKCLKVPIVDRQTCESTFDEFIYWSEGMVCAGRANTDNCLRDGGAVLECDGQLQGVQWFDHSCNDPSHPSVYTKLCLYNRWINNVMDHFTPFDTTPEPSTATQMMSNE